MKIYSIGYSSRMIAKFIALFQLYGIVYLIDVRLASHQLG